ncbi:hypothetical protein ACTXT7_002515 [Hymenolepis weldensis]
MFTVAFLNYCKEKLIEVARPTLLDLIRGQDEHRFSLVIGYTLNLKISLKNPSEVPSDIVDLLLEGCDPLPSFCILSAKFTLRFNDAEAEFVADSALEFESRLPEVVRGIKSSVSRQSDFSKGAGGGGGEDRRDRAAKLVDNFGEVAVELRIDCRLTSGTTFLVKD